MRTIAFGLKNFATIPPSLKSGTTTLKELSFKTKDPDLVPKMRAQPLFSEGAALKAAG
ncbi:hypothetical protein [Hyalangium rubrum]|uniref:Uncharacterized protein n=1 Tax=Hyalangium rubrum TaxID=3103134 RepID=A0ABU5HFT2_9BACT|nr:hypothetical protein [Hyalangium sp. s54d21]MDY7231719.1 hypothetical protein [Hyalangium sp. s54d21]